MSIVSSIIYAITDIHCTVAFQVT